MNIQIVLIAFSILIIAWALERMFTKIQSMERHVKGMRSRVNILEKRILASSKKSTPEYKPSKVRQQKPRRTVSHTQSPKSATSFAAIKPDNPKTVVCAFCSTEYPADADKCPKCNHVNIEKYRIKKKPQSSSDDDMDI
ncbi:hypothetical protein J7L68_08780 [bacterium]|nr:hypothetical protein [bacterium]